MKMKTKAKTDTQTDIVYIAAMGKYIAVCEIKSGNLYVIDEENGDTVCRHLDDDIYTVMECTQQQRDQIIAMNVFEYKPSDWLKIVSTMTKKTPEPDTVLQLSRWRIDYDAVQFVGVCVCTRVQHPVTNELCIAYSAVEKLPNMFHQISSYKIMTIMGAELEKLTRIPESVKK